MSTRLLPAPPPAVCLGDVALPLRASVCSCEGRLQEAWPHSAGRTVRLAASRPALWSRLLRVGGVLIKVFLHREGASLVAQTVENLPAMWETQFSPWVRKVPWRRQWLLTLVHLSGEPHGQRSLASYSPWGCRESATTE